ncbi:MAG: hypothetical protein AAGA85_27025, partial [Bacteroidota bacterium]
SRLVDTLEIRSGNGMYVAPLFEARILGGLEGRILEIRFTTKERIDLIISRMTLLVSKRTSSYLVDALGQRHVVDYEAKVPVDLDLSQLPFEDLGRRFPNRSARDQYGGYGQSDYAFDATGFFYVEQRDGKWFLVSPAGNPFYSLGINGVRRKSTLNNAALTRVRGREDLFQRLPAYEDCPECFSPDSAYLSFYCNNVRNRYATYEDWKSRTHRRLQAIGFNTIGNWSDTLVMGGPVPYTFTLNTREAIGLTAGHHLPDVFHPEWEAQLEEAFSKITSRQDDPYLLGYFVDNEMGWGGTARLDTASYSFKALRAISGDEEKQRVFAEKYFATVARVIRKFDSNHLYLGCRFTRNIQRHQIPAQVASKYVDVVSVNVYSMFTQEEMDTWYAIVQKPILIGEHHVPPITNRALLPRYPAFDQGRRDDILINYVRTWSSYPYAIGSHWYQYVDQEVAGRGDGGENQPVGLVSVTDQLDTHLAGVFYDLSADIRDNYLMPVE